MTKFLSGPAAGIILGLRRAPLFLRVVRNRFKADAEFDALDQFHDRPEPDELIYAYRRVGAVQGIACVRGRGGGCFAIAEYEYLADQPPFEVLRNNQRWAEWAMAEQAKGAKGATT